MICWFSLALQEKKFKCDDCGKGFGIKSNFEKHLQTHWVTNRSKRSACPPNQTQSFLISCSRSRRSHLNARTVQRDSLAKIRWESITLSIMRFVSFCLSMLLAFANFPIRSSGKEIQMRALWQGFWSRKEPESPSTKPLGKARRPCDRSEFDDSLVFPYVPSCPRQRRPFNAKSARKDSALNRLLSTIKSAATGSVSFHAFCRCDLNSKILSKVD